MGVGGPPCFRSFLDESNGWPGLKPGDLRPHQPFDLNSIMTSFRKSLLISTRLGSVIQSCDPKYPIFPLDNFTFYFVYLLHYLILTQAQCVSKLPVTDSYHLISLLLALLSM